MTMEEFWDAYTSSERDMFQKSCRRLLKTTFIVRDKDEENRKAYFFISKRSEPFSLYFSYIGYDIIVDHENGIVMLRNCAYVGENGRIQANRVALKKVESIVLCCLWSLYSDRLSSGSLSKSYLISITDLRFELERYGMRDQIDKSTLQNALTLFTRFNLIDVNGKVGDADCLIRLYPSLQFALDSEGFRQFVRATEKRMMEKNDGSAEDEEEDDADE